MKNIITIIALSLILFSCAKEEVKPRPIAAYIVTSEKAGFEVIIDANNKRETIQVKGTTFLREVEVTDGSKYYLSGKANNNFQGIHVRVYKGQYLLNDLFRYGGRELVKVEGSF